VVNFLVNATIVWPASGFEFDLPTLECHIIWMGPKINYLISFSKFSSEFTSKTIKASQSRKEHRQPDWGLLFKHAWSAYLNNLPNGNLFVAKDIISLKMKHKA